MHAAQSAKPSRSDPHAFEVGQFDPAVIANHHILDMSLAIDQGADLASRFVRQLAQLACEFRSDYLVWRYAASVQLFDAPQLVWF